MMSRKLIVFCSILAAFVIAYMIANPSLNKDKTEQEEVSSESEETTAFADINATLYWKGNNITYENETYKYAYVFECTSDSELTEDCSFSYLSNSTEYIPIEESDDCRIITETITEDYSIIQFSLILSNEIFPESQIFVKFLLEDPIITQVLTGDLSIEEYVELDEEDLETEFQSIQCFVKADDSSLAFVKLTDEGERIQANVTFFGCCTSISSFVEKCRSHLYLYDTEGNEESVLIDVVSDYDDNSAYIYFSFLSEMTSGEKCASFGFNFED